MRQVALLAMGGLLIATYGNAWAGAISSAGLLRIEGLSSVEFVQEKRSSESVTQRVKRAWKDLVGYKFEVVCPVIPLPIPLPIGVTRTTCTETGKDREDARAKCQSQHQFCRITDASR
jgi:hypothetical protein